MDLEQMEVYLKILDERTRGILEEREDVANVVKEAKEKLEYFDKKIEEIKKLLNEDDETEPKENYKEEIDKLARNLERVEIEFSEKIEELKQALKLHENFINTIRKRLDNQGSSDVKLLQYDKKMKSTFILNIIAVILSFIIPFAIIYYSMNSDKLNLNEHKNDTEVLQENKTNVEEKEININKGLSNSKKEISNVKSNTHLQENKSQPVKNEKTETKNKNETSKNVDSPKPHNNEKTRNVRESEIIYTDKEIQQ